MGRALTTVTSPVSAVFVIANPSSAVRVDGVGDEAERRLHSRVLVRLDGGVVTPVCDLAGPLYVVPLRSTI